MIERTAAELREIALGADDATGYFAALDLRVTNDVADGIAHDRFEDGARMERFVDTFAARYIGARTGLIPVARCWQATRDVARDPDLLIVQHLLLAINAHVNYDLAQAAVEVASDEGGLLAVRDDFNTINDILANTSVGVIRDLDLVSRCTSEAAWLGGGRLFNFGLREARAHRPGEPPSVSIRWTSSSGGTTCPNSTSWCRSWPI